MIFQKTSRSSKPAANNLAASNLETATVLPCNMCRLAVRKVPFHTAKRHILQGRMDGMAPWRTDL